MILTYGDVSRLQSRHWNVIELRSEKTSEETIKRIGKALKNIFKDDPAEIFVPIANRSLENLELMTDCYIFVRSLDPKKIVKIKGVTGVVWIVCHGEGTHPSRLINIDNEYIDNLIEQCQKSHSSRSLGIVPGSFVRILDGHIRDYCGIVKNINESRAVIQIDLKTTSMLLETPIKNLLNMNHVPEELRVFYYSELLDLNDQELKELLAEDLVGDRMIDIKIRTVEDSFQEAVKELETFNNKPKTKRNNQQMITAFVKNLIFDGEKDLRTIATKLFAAIKEDKIKRPKNLIIAWCVLKYHITNTMYGQDPDIKVYKDVIDKYGDSYKITIKELASMAPWLPIKTENKRKRKEINVKKRKVS